MRIPLNEFELHISETILSRGLTYYRNGFVIESEEHNPGEYEFIVRGRIQADRLINKIRLDYPRRRALLEELNRI